MKKICVICNSNIVYSKTKGYCSNCRREIQRTINFRINEHKEATRFFFSNAKQRVENKDYYYNIIKNNIEILNQINDNYPYVVKNSKESFNYIKKANSDFKNINYIIKKSGVSN